MSDAITTADRAIIRILQENARASFADISRTTGIPESTVRRRIERLQQMDVIEFAVVADPAKLGYTLRAAVGLRVDIVRLEAIAETIAEMDEVTFAGFLTGNFDILLQVVVRSQESLVGFLRRIAEVPGVRSTETFVMPWIIKPATEWVLPSADDVNGEAVPNRVRRRR